MTARSPRSQKTLSYDLPNQPAQTLGVSYTDPASVPAGQPPVVLVHGLRGDMSIWQTLPPPTLPALQSGPHPAPPPLLPRLVQVDAPWNAQEPTGLWAALESAGFAGVGWRQNDGGGPLPGGTDHEVAAVVDFARQTYGADKVFLVGHSRGGLVIRAYLTHADAPGKVAAAVTLGTPHYGSRLPAVAGQVEGALADALLGFFGLPGKLAAWAVTPLIQRTLNDFTTRFYADLDMIAWKVPRNPRLVQLLTDSYHPQVRYVAVAGTDPYISDARIYHYTPASFLPSGFPPRFNWQESTYPPPGQPPGQITRLLGDLADQVNNATLQAMPELYAPSVAQPEGGDGCVPKWSAWFADEELDPAKGYIKNYKFPCGHSQLPRDPAVQAAVIQELRAVLTSTP